MRWRTERVPRYDHWHRWLAWHPVDIDGVRVWLETVERIRRFHYTDFYEYRFAEDK